MIAEKNEPLTSVNGPTAFGRKAPSVFLECVIFTVATIAALAVASLVSWNMRQEAGVWTVVVMATLCYVPGIIVLGLGALKQYPALQTARVLGGSALRLLLIGLGTVVLINQEWVDKPFLVGTAAIFYLFTLTVETGLVLWEQSATPTNAPRRSV